MTTLKTKQKLSIKKQFTEVFGEAMDEMKKISHISDNNILQKKSMEELLKLKKISNTEYYYKGHSFKIFYVKKQKAKESGWNILDLLTLEQREILPWCCNRIDYSNNCYSAFKVIYQLMLELNDVDNINNEINKYRR